MHPIIKKWLLPIGRAIVCLFCLATVLLYLPVIVGMTGTKTPSPADSGVQLRVMDKYDTHINNQTSNALDGVISIEKVYWLNDSDLIAPKPRADGYVRGKTYADVESILAEAKPLLGEQTLLFGPESPVARGTEIRTYRDETILVVSWKELIGSSMYTFCEVKLSHPSQFRRFLSGGEYGSQIQVPTSQMAATVNSVVASSGDFYSFRREGVIVYNGQVRRSDTDRVDTCFLDSQGNLIFSHAGELNGVEAAQKFVDEKGIRFSVSFGPIMIENGQQVDIDRNYYLGQPPDPYPRAALCQLDDLHYLIVMVNKELGATSTISIYTFSDVLYRKGIHTAYCLDGGQTATLVMEGEVVNKLATGSERFISDIIYFATALPEGS